MKRCFLFVFFAFVWLRWATCETQSGGHNVIIQYSIYIVLCWRLCGRISYEPCVSKFTRLTVLWEILWMLAGLGMLLMDHFMKGVSTTGTGRIASYIDGATIHIVVKQKPKPIHYTAYWIQMLAGCFTAKDTTTYGCRDEIEITKGGGAVTYHVVYKFTGKTTQGGGGVEWTGWITKKRKRPDELCRCWLLRIRTNAMFGRYGRDGMAGNSYLALK